MREILEAIGNGRKCELGLREERQYHGWDREEGERLKCIFKFY